MTDALNDEIVLGNVYGYSQNTNGITTIVVGIAHNFTKQGVTLMIIARKRALYSEDPKLDITNKKPTVTVKGNMLFPVKLEE